MLIPKRNTFCILPSVENAQSKQKLKNEMLAQKIQQIHEEHPDMGYRHREFHAAMPNEKWLTDVTEYKYYIGIEVHKVN